MDIDETTYLQERSRQLVQRAGLRRRDVLRLGAALPLAAGVARFAAPTAARAAEAAVSSPIVKPLPPAWFVELRHQRRDALGLGRRPRLPMPNERFFVRNHTSTPVIDERTWRLRVHGSGCAGRASS